MRKVDWIALLLVIIVAVVGRFMGPGDQVPENLNPRRPSPDLFAPRAWDSETRAWLKQEPSDSRNQIPSGAPLPSHSIVDGGGTPASSTGSAASVSADGYWLTARHVVQGCHETVIQTGDRSGIPVRRTVLHPRADIALLITDGSPQGIPVSVGPNVKSEAFGVGFPRGQPGVVQGRYLGQLTAIYHREGFRERVDAWSKVSEIPRRLSSLGGLSGGAVIDGTGRIIGVVQSESQRRGRFMTARPETVRSIFELADIKIPGAGSVGSQEVTDENYPSIARALITSLRVAKVHCRVG